MTVGINTGGQLNVFMFELGMKTTNPVTGEDMVITLAVHPLVVAPQSISVTDTSRSAINELTDAALLTRGGRALLSYRFAGTFGVEDRGLGAYLGTGELRFQKFYNEIVRMAEAINREEIDEALDLVFGTPALQSKLALWDPEHSELFINFYDFWHRRSFEVLVRSFMHERAAHKASASGAIYYNMAVEQVGPLAQGGIASSLLEQLNAALAYWTGINENIESYNIDALVAAASAPFNTMLTQLASTLEAVRSQLDAATGVMSSRGGTSTLLTDFFTNTNKLATIANEIANKFDSGTFQPSDPGFPDWSTSGHDYIAALDRFDIQADLWELETNALFQSIAGVLFGMDVDAFQAYTSSAGQAGLTHPNISGSIIHVVGPTDNDSTISLAYGVAWEDVLEANDLTPDEALRAGTELQIPRVRSLGPQPIDGLPTFGSHLGQSAWGSDIRAELIAADDGDLWVVSGREVMVQGVEYLLDEFGGDILKGVAGVVSFLRSPYLEDRLQQLYLSDPRVAGIQSLQIDDTAVGYDARVILTAINGGTVRTGGTQ